MADEKKVVTATKAPKLTVEHFMANAFKPHQGMLEVSDKDPNFKYRLVKNTPARIRYFQQRGYEVVTAKDDAKMQDTGQVDGRRIAGANSLVLMKQPMEYHEMYMQALRRKSANTKRGPIESFKEKARQMDVEVVDEMREMRGPLEAALAEDMKR